MFIFWAFLRVDDREILTVKRGSLRVNKESRWRTLNTTAIVLERGKYKAINVGRCFSVCICGYIIWCCTDDMSDGAHQDNDCHL